MHKAKKENMQISMEETTLPTTPEEIEAEETKQARVDNLKKWREKKEEEE